MILIGDCLEHLRSLPDESVNCIVTSPPYYGLRDYGMPGQIGLEKTPREFIDRMTEVFRECRRVLRSDGTCWVNMGDSYAGTTGNQKITPQTAYTTGRAGGNAHGGHNAKKTLEYGSKEVGFRDFGEYKPKDLLGIPWRLAFALQDDGWYLRSDIIWAKPNPMPESVTDRPTKAHEYVFLLTKSAKYWYNADAIAEVSASRGEDRGGGVKYSTNITVPGQGKQNLDTYGVTGETRNARTVWTIATQPYKEAHFATFPEELPRRCISAGCPEGGTVLDPFLGSGTTAAVAVRLGRKWIGIELNPEYAELAMKRINAETPSLFGVTT